MHGIWRTAAEMGGGWLSGMMLGLSGAGGTAVAGPVFLEVVRTARMHERLASAALAVTLTVLVAAVDAVRRRQIPWPALYRLGGPALAGLAIGHWVHRQVMTPVLSALIMAGFFLVNGIWAAFLRSWWIAWYTRHPRLRRIPAEGAGLVLGFLGGFGGVGTSFLTVPALWISGIPEAGGMGVALLLIAGLALFNAVYYGLHRAVDWHGVLAYGIGGLFGGLWIRRFQSVWLPRRRWLDVVWAVIMMTAAVVLVITQDPRLYRGPSVL